MVRVRVNVAWSDWPVGSEQTVERTRLVDGMIRNGVVTVLDDDVPDWSIDIGEPVGTIESGLIRIRDADGNELPLPDVFAENLADVQLAYDTGEWGSTGKGTLTVDAVAVPPKTGKGSGVDEWREFLGSQNIPFPGDATRSDLIELWTAEAAKRFG